MEAEKFLELNNNKLSYQNLRNEAKSVVTVEFITLY